MVFSPCTKELENFAARCVVLLLYLQCVQKKKGLRLCCGFMFSN